MSQSEPDFYPRENIIADNPIKEVVEDYNITLKLRNGEFWGLCPFHKEKTASFSVNEQLQTFHCFGCGAGGSVIDFVAKMEGITEGKAMYKLTPPDERPEERAKRRRSQANGATIAPQRKSHFQPSEAKKVAPRPQPEPKLAPEKPEVEVCAYDYQDETGKVIYQAIRYTPKTFKQCKMEDGKRVWTMEGVRRVLYHLPEVINSQTVWITEGEKDADNLRKLGFVATCNVGGAKAWQPDYALPLRGKQIIICGDNDEAGQAHIQAVVDSISGLVESFQVIQLPKKFKDVSDWIDSLDKKLPPSTVAERLQLNFVAGCPLLKTTEEYAAIKKVSRIGDRITIDELLRFDPENDENCLLGRRWICRGAACLWVGPSGVGKSVLSMQAIVKWALGLPFLGIKPARKLKSLLIQNENDIGDLAEMLNGVLNEICKELEAAGTPITSAELVRTIKENVIIYRCVDKVGSGFISACRDGIEFYRPDLLWVDPLYTYAGDDLSQQKACAQFLCVELGPVLKETGVAFMLMHHTGKPPSDARARKGWTDSDYQYAGLGSSILTNWPRAINVLERIKTTDESQKVFVLRFAKRGDKCGAKTLQGHYTSKIYLRHSQNGNLYWEQIDEPGEDEIDNSSTSKGKPGRPKVKLDLLPFARTLKIGATKSQIIARAAKHFKCSENRFWDGPAWEELFKFLCYDGNDKSYFFDTDKDPEAKPEGKE